MSDDDLYQGSEREPHDPDADAGCKDCCSLLFGAFSLTGLVALLVPMLIHKWRTDNDLLDDSKNNKSKGREGIGLVDSRKKIDAQKLDGAN